MKSKRCLSCGCRFVPNFRVSYQTFCPKKECQQARRNQWLARKIKRDLDYKQSRIESQNKWVIKQLKQRSKIKKGGDPAYSEALISNLTQSECSNPKKKNLNIVVTADLLTQLIRKKEINCKIVLV